MLTRTERREFATASASLGPYGVEAESQALARGGERAGTRGVGKPVDYALVVVVGNKISRAVTPIVTQIEGLVTFGSIPAVVSGRPRIGVVDTAGTLGHGGNLRAIIAGKNGEGRRGQ